MLFSRKSRKATMSSARPARAASRQADAVSCVIERLEGRQLMSAASLDPTFGTGGEVNTPLGSVNDYGNAIAVDFNGASYVAGTSNGHMVVSKYKKNGQLDTSFDGDGKVYFNYGGNERAAGISIKGGKITVVGTNDSLNKIVVGRLNMNGSYDTSFNGYGEKYFKFTVNTSYGYYTESDRSWAAGVDIQSDGKIIIAGTSDTYVPAIGKSESCFVLARLNKNGSFDNTFGFGGSAADNYSNNGVIKQEAECMKIQNDGRILVGGRDDSGAGLTRFNTNGTVDWTFANSGHAYPKFGSSYEFITSVDVDGAGHIIAGGFRSAANHTVPALAKFKANGALDGSFSGDGLMVYSTGSATALSSVKFQNDGQILALGGSTSGNGNFQLARFNPDGTFDSNFGSGGYTYIDFGGANDMPSDMAITVGEKIVMAGTTTKNGDSNQALARIMGHVPLMSIVPNDNAVVGKHPGSFRIQRYGDPYDYDATVLHFTVTGTAKQGVDFTFGMNLPITFLPGQTTMIVDVNPVKNYLPKTVKYVNVTLNADPTYDIFINTAVIAIYPS